MEKVKRFAAAGLCIGLIALLCGCVKVEPQEKMQDGLPVFGSEYSIFEPDNPVVNIDEERYVSAGDVGWYLYGDQEKCGWVDYNGNEKAMLWCSERSRQDGIYEVMFTLKNQLSLSLVYHKEGINIPEVSAKSVGKIVRRINHETSETEDRSLIENLFHDLQTGRERPEKNWEDTTQEMQPGTFFIICGEYPELRNSFFLLYDNEYGQYYVRYEFKKDLKPILGQTGKHYRVVFISDEVAKKLLAI